MRVPSLCAIAVTLALSAACGSAHAFSASGSYVTTFSFASGATTQYCVTLTSQGASATYRDEGSATFYSAGAQVGAGSYVVMQKAISVAVGFPENTSPASTQYLTATGQFSAGQAFNTGVIEFSGSIPTIIGTATFQYSRNHGPCAGSSS